MNCSDDDDYIDLGVVESNENDGEDEGRSGYNGGEGGGRGRGQNIRCQEVASFDGGVDEFKLSSYLQELKSSFTLKKGREND